MGAVEQDISRSVAPIVTPGKPSQSLGTGPLGLQADLGLDAGGPLPEAAGEGEATEPSVYGGEHSDDDDKEEEDADGASRRGAGDTAPLGRAKVVRVRDADLVERAGVAGGAIRVVISVGEVAAAGGLAGAARARL